MYKRTYRFTREGVQKIVEMLEEKLMFSTKRGQPASPLIQVKHIIIAMVLY